MTTAVLCHVLFEVTSAFILYQTEMDQAHMVRMGVGNGLRQDVWREFLTRFGNIKMCEVYGSTEGNLCFMNHIGRIGVVGRSNFFYRVSVQTNLKCQFETAALSTSWSNASVANCN
ncbi:hypothetical protein XENOCAPTIV_020250 [Xenoophorus captivus]|uniref:Uncharacterized protein n=1 Tax=Xenoophorus captivus TaxID=1517983 RepID=A0ABV0S7Z1_9TELE